MANCNYSMRSHYSVVVVQYLLVKQQKVAGYVAGRGHGWAGPGYEARSGSHNVETQSI